MKVVGSGARSADFEGLAPGMNSTTPAGRTLSAQNISKRFYKDGVGFEALRDVSFHIGSGEFVCLIGPSGCGKSTLLRIIGGLERPTTGEIRVASEITESRRNIGLMLQSPTLLPWRTVRSNILLPIELRGRVTREDVQAADDLIKVVGLEGFESHYPKELSGGMQQRVALSRLLIINPDILLLDEPFGALDEFTRERLNLELAQTVASMRKTAVLVTHNIVEAVFLADKIFPMLTRPGRLAEAIEVPFERPRSTSLMRTEAFTRLVFQVREALGLGES